MLGQLVDMLKLLAGAKPPALTPGLTLLLTMSVNDAADAPSVGSTQVRVAARIDSPFEIEGQSVM